MRASLVTSVVAHVALLLWYLVSIADPKPLDAAAVEPMTVDLVLTEQVDQPANPSLRSTIDIARPSPMPDRQLGPDNRQRPKGNSIPATLQPTQLNEPKTTSSMDAPPVGELVVGPRIAAPLPYSPSTNLAESQSTGFDSPAESAANLSVEEITAFKMQVQRCWNAPAGVSDIEKLHVVMRVSLARNGALSTRPILIEGSASRHGPALVESAVRALRQCQPYRLWSADRYDEWKVLDLNFSPSGLSGG